MDARDHSIIAQTCVKAACDLYTGSQAPGNALEAAMMFYEWVVSVVPTDAAGGGAPSQPPASSPAAQDTFPPRCPDCGGPMWDNRVGKRNPKSPDAKCKDKTCGKGVWLTPYQP